MTRKEYLNLALCQPVEWLKAVAAHDKNPRKADYDSYS